MSNTQTHTHTCAHIYTNMHTQHARLRDVHACPPHTYAHTHMHIHTSPVCIPVCTEQAPSLVCGNSTASPPGDATKGPERHATWMSPCKVTPRPLPAPSSAALGSPVLLPRLMLGSLPLPWRSAPSGGSGECTPASSGRRTGRKELGHHDFISLGQADFWAMAYNL